MPLGRQSPHHAWLSVDAIADSRPRHAVSLDMPVTVGTDTLTGVRVLYVGGVPRSGSTLTDLILDRLPGHRAVGELFYLIRNGAKHNTACSCGVPFAECGFWSDVGKAAFGGWEQLDVPRFLAIQNRVDRTANIPAIRGGLGTRAFGHAVTEYIDYLTRIYGALDDVTDGEVIVDSSKRPSLPYALRQVPGMDLRCVHVVRDPRGVAYSFGKQVDLPQGSDTTAQMPRSSALTVARRWVTVNASIAGLARRGVPYLRVRYEDLVADPVATFARVALFQDVRADHSAEFLTEAGIAVQPTHIAVGGRIRHADGVLPIRLDEEWRTRLPVATRRLVTALTVSARRRYGYR